MKRFLLLFILIVLQAPTLWAQQASEPTFYTNPEAALQVYHSALTRLRQEYPNHRDLPKLNFFLFGMGQRAKYIYRQGRLIDAFSGHIEEQWTVESELVVPSEYLVQLKLTNGTYIQIREDETGVWILQAPSGSAQKAVRNTKPRRIANTKSVVNLPRFSDNTYGPILRVLHHETLINLVNGRDEITRPLPNLFVYQKPRYRDAAMMAMVLRETDNLALLRPWIMSLRDPFDRYSGVVEADNLGQVLFLVSLVSDQTHPVVQVALDSVNRFKRTNYIVGQTDNAEHPVYQTKWLKYGLKSLRLSDPYVVPGQCDSYSAFFWCDYTDKYIPGEKINQTVNVNHPYLSWAEDHFYDRTGTAKKRGVLGTSSYPLSWEEKASYAHYPGLTVLDKDLIRQKLAFPHGWHAAELFLLLSANPRK